MSEQDEALNWATVLESHPCTARDTSVAACLRRQHAEIERVTTENAELKRANREGKDWVDSAAQDIERLTAELRQRRAVTEMLEDCQFLARRLTAERDALREALQRAIPYIATAMVGCNGDKCREPWCYSCCGEEAARKAAQEGCDACANARAALQGAKE